MTPSQGEPRPPFQPPQQPWAPTQQYQGPWPPQEPYGQQYPPPQQWQQQPYQPPPGGHRSPRHTGRNILAVIGAAFGLLVAIGVIAAVAGSGHHTVTTGQASRVAASSAPASSASSAPAAKAKAAGVGSTITLSGFSGDEQMAVTVVKVDSHAQAATEFDGPDPGDRLVAVQFRLKDTGSAAYSDSPSNGAGITDAAGQSYQSWYGDAAECQSFPSSENIAPGSSGLGCIVFEVPKSAVITQVQFTLDSGMGPQTGQWDVRG